MKKIMGDDKKKEFDELLFKKVGDFNNFEKMELGLLISNLKNGLKELCNN